MSSTERGEPSSQSPPAKKSLISSMAPSSPTSSGSFSTERKRPRVRVMATPPPAELLNQTTTTLLDCIPGAVFRMVVHDGSARISYISEYCESIFNMTSLQIKANANALFSLIHLNDRQSFQDSIVESMSSLQIWDWKGRLCTCSSEGVKDEIKFVHFKSTRSPTRLSADGSSTEWCGIILDVTEVEKDRQKWRQNEREVREPIKADTRQRYSMKGCSPENADSPPENDSTDSNSAARALASDVAAASVARLRDLFDSAPHPLIGLDTRGHVMEWNRTAERITGYAKSEVLGRKFVDEFVLGACHRDVVRMLDEILLGDNKHQDRKNSNDDNRNQASGSADCAELRRDGTSSQCKRGKAGLSDPSCEATLQTKDGHRPVHLLLTASALRDFSSLTSDSKQGKIIGAVIIAQDISRQHTALALHRSETEKGIMEWLSHEVRNPLSVAVEASRTLKEDPSDDPEENSNNLELICLSLGYIVELLTDMLDLNKCIEGKITMNPSPCKMREDILLPTKRMLDQRRKCVDLLIDDDIEIVANVDRLRLQQVLTNLIVNSMKYTSVGFIRVSMRLIRKGELGMKHLECATGQQIRWVVPGYHWRENEDDRVDMFTGLEKGRVASFNLFGGHDNDIQIASGRVPENGVGVHPEAKRRRLNLGEESNNKSFGLEGSDVAGVLVTVSDSGSGIDPTNYPNLFERWERLGSKTNGTGIGLCLCRSLMEVMGGRIFLSKGYDSGLGEDCRGCRFGVILPPSVLELPTGTCTSCGNRVDVAFQAHGGGLPRSIVRGAGIGSSFEQQAFAEDGVRNDDVGLGNRGTLCRICLNTETAATAVTSGLDFDEPSSDSFGGGNNDSGPPNTLSVDGSRIGGAASSAAVAAAMEEAAANTYAINQSDSWRACEQSLADHPSAIAQESFSIFGTESDHRQPAISHIIDEESLPRPPTEMNSIGVSMQLDPDGKNSPSSAQKIQTATSKGATAGIKTESDAVSEIAPACSETGIVGQQLASQSNGFIGRSTDGGQGLPVTVVTAAPAGKTTAQQTAQRTAAAAARAAANSLDPFHNTCLRGHFRVLVVDDDGTFRKMFCRRITRIMPNAIVDESPSGEDALERAKGIVYDLITMDHFMALDGLNGADTIRLLRSNHCDACIVGISGNTKTAHHLEAGADDFIRKPVPNDSKLLRRLVSKMSPPAVWNVLVADDCALNLKFMHRKLVSVSSPHYISKKDSERRWRFTLKSNAKESIDALKEESYDLVVLDQHMGPGLKGTDVADFLRSGSKNPDAIVVINSGEEIKMVPTLHPSAPASLDTSPGKATIPSFNFQWTKPAPSINAIRQDLCLELIREKSPSTTAAFPRLARKSSPLIEPSAGDDVFPTSAASVKGAHCVKYRSLIPSSVGSDAPDDMSSVVSHAGSDCAFRPTGDDGASIPDPTPRSGHANEDSGTTSGLGGCSRDGTHSKKLPRETIVLQKLYDELGDEKTFHDMCCLFIANIPAQLDSIDRLINSGDWVRLSAVLHTLKGTLQVFHLDWNELIVPMNELCVKLRDKGKSLGTCETKSTGFDKEEQDCSSAKIKSQASESSETSATDEEVSSMRKFATHQRLVLGQVIGVCHGVLSDRDCD